MKLRHRGFVGQTTQEVTAREPKHRLLARKAAAEGFVLLKNDGMMLPIAKETKLGLYGAGAVKTIKGDTGSGDVNERDCVNIYQGLLNAGYEVTSADWLKAYEKTYDQARLDWRDAVFAKEAALPETMENRFFEAYSSLQFMVPCGDPIDEAKALSDGADTAIFVLSRVAGENSDRHEVPGDYFITDEEHALIEQVCKCYERVLLVINTGGLVDLAFIDDFPKIKAILQFMQAGQEGGNAFADVISGAVTPSGKMTDSWALHYSDYPNAAYFSSASGDVLYEKYLEGIYMGYRYFDTFDVPVRYPFGFGMSYTSFDVKTDEIQVENPESPVISVKVTVTNTGDTYAGKEVVQVYVSCPQGRLTKEFKRLSSFGKTQVLAPGQSQQMTISFKMEQLTSFDEAASAYVYEKGLYGIWVGTSVADASLSGSLDLTEDVTYFKVGKICPVQDPFEELCPDAALLAAKTACWQAEAKSLPCVVIDGGKICTSEASYAGIPETFDGEAGAILEKLSLDQLVALVTGDPGMGQGSALGAAGQSVPGAAAETTKAAEADGVASIVLADGPAGLRLNKTYEVKDGMILKNDFLGALEGGFFSKPKEVEGDVWYQYCTAIPVGTLLAQTWDLDLIKEIGAMIAEEMTLFEVTLWLAPGMNIHRNPLCGRNFEYYSEDPLLSGMMAAAMTLGVQSKPGCGTTIKHFALNNQEDNRMGSDSMISERTLREIYLKNFEIAVRNAQPMSIMTSYNMINGVHAANCYDTCTKATRDEWGFAGVIMTDWTTTTASTAGICNAAGCVRAGNDLTMPGDPSDHVSIRSELAAGTLSLNELKRCAYNTIKVILQSNQYEDCTSYLDQFEGLDTYMNCR